MELIFFEIASSSSEHVVAQAVRRIHKHLLLHPPRVENEFCRLLEIAPWNDAKTQFETFGKEQLLVYFCLKNKCIISENETRKLNPISVLSEIQFHWASSSFGALKARDFLKHKCETSSCFASSLAFSALKIIACPGIG